MNRGIDNDLWWIQHHISKDHVIGMVEKCAEQTISEVIEMCIWEAETRIPDGAVDMLKVAECSMLGVLWLEDKLSS